MVWGTVCDVINRRHCYGLNVGVPPDLPVESLIPDVTVFGDGACEGQIKVQ